MFPPISVLHRIGGLQRLHRLAYLPARIHTAKRRSAPSVPHLLLAGLAVVAFVKLMTVANRGRRSRFSAMTIGVLLFAVGALVISLRRSARRNRW